MPIDTERQWSTDGPIPMDPESNWDICPVCRAEMKKLEWISVGLMRSRHNAHKAAEAIGTDPDSVQHNDDPECSERGFCPSCADTEGREGS